MSAVADFVNQYLPTAQSVGSQTGLAPEFILGVAGLESGWGQHYTNNNLFGITGGNYASPEDSFAAFGNLMQSPHYGYPNVLAAGSDPLAQASALGGTQYNTVNPDYGSSLQQTVAMVQGVTGNSSGSNPTAASQTGWEPLLRSLPSWLYQPNFDPTTGKLKGGPVQVPSILPNWQDIGLRVVIALIAILLIGLGSAALALKSEVSDVVKGNV